MTLKEYLSQARFLDNAIDAKVIQLEELKKSLERSAGEIRFTENNSKPSRAYLIAEKIILLEEELNNDIDILVDTKIEILHLLKKIDDLTLRTALEYHYLSYLTWEEIADKMYISLRQLYNWNKKAMEILEGFYSENVS